MAAKPPIWGTEDPEFNSDSLFIGYVPTKWEVRREKHQRWIASYLVKMQRELSSRRNIPWHVTGNLTHPCLSIRNPDGTPFVEIDILIDAVFGNDPSYSWYRDFQRFAHEAPLQAPQDRIIPRLQALDISARFDAWLETTFAQNSD